MNVEQYTIEERVLREIQDLGYPFVWVTDYGCSIHHGLFTVCICQDLKNAAENNAAKTQMDPYVKVPRIKHVGMPKINNRVIPQGEIEELEKIRQQTKCGTHKKCAKYKNNE